VNGLVTEHISPYRQSVVAPLFKDVGSKLGRRVSDNWFVMGVPFAALFGTIEYLKWQYDQNERAHWP
jgi:hypothetical protein